MSRLYDVFVDWPGRLAREMPGIEARLREVNARRVLDVGCGTGRHVQALLQLGFDAHGADASDEMLAKARVLLNENANARAEVDVAQTRSEVARSSAHSVPNNRSRFYPWRMGDELPGPLRELAPFDGLIAMGNVWPMLVDSSDAQRAARSFRELVRPGGLLLLGLKAFAIRRAQKQPYLPLLKRRHEGRALWFSRFVDFDVPQPNSAELVCDLHMSILAGEADSAKEALHHGATRVRAWSPEELAHFFEHAGFRDVRVHARLEDRNSSPTGEDVFVSAFTP